MPRISYADAVAQLRHNEARFAIDEVIIEGVSTKVWRTAPASLREVLERSRRYEHAPYLVYENERISYAQHYQHVCQLGQTLVTEFGVEPGDRIALVMRNYPEWPTIFWATVSIGAIIVPLNAWWEVEELHYALNDCQPKVLFMDSQRADTLTHLFDRLPIKHFVCARTSMLCAPMKVYDSLITATDSEAIMPAVKLAPDMPATLFYTSGTTGQPKGALGTHRNICNNLISSAFHKAVADIRRDHPVPQTRPTGHLLSVPLFHATGCHSMLCGNTMSGNKLVFMHKWSAEKAIQLIESEGLSSFGGVPSMVWQVLESPEFTKHDLSSVTHIMYGGAPAAPELAKRIHQLLPNVQPSNGYGLTETSALATSNQAEDYLECPASVGRPAPVTQLKVVNDAGEPLGTDEIGELWIKGPNIVKGYWNNPQACAQFFTHGWLHSGDLARIDTQGRVYIVDRAKDMIIRAGENVYCVEVENVLYSHPDIMDAAVVGLPHKILGEEVGAVIQLVPHSTLNEQDIIDFTEGKIAAYKRPIKIKIGYEPLPRNANGKILKKQLTLP
jgi:steroid-24-oyl-CoA synthetase